MTSQTSSTGEFEIIASLTRGAQRSSKDLFCGVGDDCAVISGPSGRDWIVTTDALIEGVHFQREWGELKLLGRKALSVNLSDIAAMGGVPRFYLVSLGLDPRDAKETAEKIYFGLREIALEFGTELIGGDTVASPKGLMVSITAIGEVDSGKAILRSGARPGDSIYVTGELGSSALGLHCLERKNRKREDSNFIKRHLDPFPRVAIGRVITGSGVVTSMIDVSDGLVADLSHIADASGVGFEIVASKIPRNPLLRDVTSKFKKDATNFILTGGEDYELLFTVDGGRVAEFEEYVKKCADECPITQIGKIVADRTHRRVLGDDGCDIKIGSAGFDHFKRA